MNIDCVLWVSIVYYEYRLCATQSLVGSREIAQPPWGVLSVCSSFDNLRGRQVAYVNKTYILSAATPPVAVFINSSGAGQTPGHVLQSMSRTVRLVRRQGVARLVERNCLSCPADQRSPTDEQMLEFLPPKQRIKCTVTKKVNSAVLRLHVFASGLWQRLSWFRSFVVFLCYSWRMPDKAWLFALSFAHRVTKEYKIQEADFGDIRVRHVSRPAAAAAIKLSPSGVSVPLRSSGILFEFQD